MRLFRTCGNVMLSAILLPSVEDAIKREIQKVYVQQQEQEREESIKHNECEKVCNHLARVDALNQQDNERDQLECSKDEQKDNQRNTMLQSQRRRVVFRIVKHICDFNLCEKRIYWHFY